MSYKIFLENEHICLWIDFKTWALPISIIWNQFGFRRVRVFCISFQWRGRHQEKSIMQKPLDKAEDV